MALAMRHQEETSHTENSLADLLLVEHNTDEAPTLSPDHDIRRYSDQTCDASFTNPMANFVVGVSYHRKYIVMDKLSAYIGHNAFWLDRVSKLVGTELVSNAIGVDHDNIMDKAVSKAGKKAAEAGARSFVDLALQRTERDDKGEKGMMLLEFRLCRITNSTRLFHCKLAKEGSILGEGGLFHDAAYFLWDTVNSHFKSALSTIVLKMLEAKLPGKALGALQKKGIPPLAANVCVFSGQIGDDKNTKKLFKRLKKCKQARAKVQKPKAFVSASLATSAPTSAQDAHDPCRPELD